MLRIKTPSDWEYLPIGKVANEVVQRNKKGEDLPVLSCTKHDGLVDSLLYFGRRVYSADTSGYKVVPRNHFAYATNHIEEGSIGYQTAYPKALISPIYTVFKTKPEMDDSYLAFLFKTELYRHLFEISTSASVDRRGSLRWKYFSQLFIPKPPLAEQKKIAEILETWNQAIESLEKQLEYKKKCRFSVQELLLTRYAIKEYQLKDIGKSYAGLSGKAKEDFMGEGKPFITYKNVYFNTKVDREKLSYVRINKDEKQNRVKYGDILFTVSSETPEEVGFSSVLLDNIPELYLNSFCFGYRLNSFTELLPEFARFLFRGRNFRRSIYKLAQGYTRYNLSRTEVMKLTVKVPSIDNQKKIAKLLSAMEKEEELLAMKTTSFKKQRVGLMQKLLTGKIRVKV